MDLTNSAPRFSVVVPAYNAAATIRETLDAIAAQEFEDWECVVVDDGSIDDTAPIVREYAERDGRFRLVQQENTGTAGANNAGVRAATADLLVTCSADDILLPNHLAVMDELITREPDYQIYSSNGKYLDHETHTVSEETANDWTVELSRSFAEVVDVCFYSVGAVYRRTMYDAVGGYRLGVYVDDYDLWLRGMARGARHRYTPEVLSLFRRSAFHQSASVVRVLEADIEALQNLITGGWVAAEQVPIVEAAIDARRSRIEAVAWEQRTGDRLRSFRSLLGRVVGAERASRIMHLGAPVMARLRKRKGLW